jgi:hypothetical protein
MQMTAAAKTPWDDETGEVYDGGDGPAQPDHQVGPTEIRDMVPEDGSVFAMIVHQARSIVRDQKKLIDAAVRIGGWLGKKGFYRFPAGNKTVEGESVHLAQALAQEWGGIVYQTRIVRVEPLAGGTQRVHLRSSVADLVKLVCAEIDHVVTTSRPPGKYANDPEQAERWISMQTQNASSKVVRNCILDVLPKWYTNPALQAAKDMADAKALGWNKDKTPRTLAQARDAAIESLQDFGCKLEELEQHVDLPKGMWATPQIDSLRELWGDMKHGRVSVEAWRHGLNEPEPTNQQQQQQPGRSRLGLPAATGAKTLSEEEAKAEPAKVAEPVAKPTAKKTDATLPGVGK